MSETSKFTGLKVWNTLSFLVMIAINALANLLPINGVKTGEVSDAYPNLFTPTPITFAIWGLIYLLLAGFVLFQLGVFGGAKGADQAGLMKKIGLLFALSSFANAAWIFAWHYGQILISVALMLILLVSLILIVSRIGKATLSTRERIFVRLPFSVYLGWITVATIANITALLVSLGWDGWGISEEAWTVIILAAGLLIALAFILKNKDAAYGLVIIWAYAGILIKHLSPAGFSGRYPAVIIAAIVCIVLLLAAVIYAFFSPRKKEPSFEHLRFRKTGD